MSRPLLDADGLDRKPQTRPGDESWWYYEEKQGILLCVERSTDRKVEQVMIPFRTLARSLRRIAKARGVRL